MSEKWSICKNDRKFSWFMFHDMSSPKCLIKNRFFFLILKCSSKSPCPVLWHFTLFLVHLLPFLHFLVQFLTFFSLTKSFSDIFHLQNFLTFSPITPDRKWPTIKLSRRNLAGLLRSLKIPPNQPWIFRCQNPKPDNLIV